MLEKADISGGMDLLAVEMRSLKSIKKEYNLNRAISAQNSALSYDSWA